MAQWRIKVRNLMRLGFDVQAVVTSTDPWRSSKSSGVNQVLSNAYLKSQGLYELRDDWIKFHLYLLKSSMRSCICGAAYGVLLETVSYPIGCHLSYY